MLIKVDELTARIGEAATTLRNQTDKSSDDRSEYVTLRERQLDVREERLVKIPMRGIANKTRHMYYGKDEMTQLLKGSMVAAGIKDSISALVLKPSI